MLVLFTVHQKNPQTLQLVRSPGLSNVVRISQVGTRIKLEVLIIIPVRPSNRCEFILVRSVFILHDTGKYTRRHSTKDTRETRASVKIAWGAKTWCARCEHVSECSFCLTILEWKETARSLDTGPESYVGKIQSLSYYFMTEWAHRRKNGICKRGINLLPEKDNMSSSGRNLSGW